jgi:hypothetical protein
MGIINEAIQNLWFWTYGIIVGWGASFTIMLALIAMLFIKIVQVNKRISYLYNRLVTHERETSLNVDKI